MTIYQNFITDLKLAISNYKKGFIDLNSLKSILWDTASKIVSLEDKELRSCLQQTEAELDSLQFTVDEELIFDESLKILVRIEPFLKAE